MKAYFLYLGLLLGSLQLMAQETALFHGGGYVGMSTSQLSGDNSAGFNRIGLYAGTFVNVHVSPRSLLQLELSYIMKGSRDVSKTMGLIYASNLQYFEAPLLYKFSFNGIASGNKIFGAIFRHLELETGPAIGWLIKSDSVERDSYRKYNDPNMQPWSKIDLSVMAGLNIKIVEHFKVNVRFSQSVLPVRRPKSGIHYRLNYGQYNSVVSLTLVVEY
jgi:hypothetical protein